MHLVRLNGHMAPQTKRRAPFIRLKYSDLCQSLRVGLCFLSLLIVLPGGPVLLADAPTSSLVMHVDAVIEAARLGDMGRLQRLLDDGASPNGDSASRWMYPPLFHALHARQFEMARVLIDRGARVKSTEGESVPLVWAARAGDANIVKLMLAKGADPKAREYFPNTGSHGPTAMEMAVSWGRLAVMKELEKAGVPVLGDDSGALALRLTGLYGYADCATYLLDHGAKVDAKYDGNTAMDGAILNNNLEVLKVLLAHGANFNGTSDGAPIGGWDSYRRTPVVMAVLASQREALELLLQRGADVRALDNLAMKWADLLGDEAAWRRLKEAGAPEPKPFAFRTWAGPPIQTGAPDRGRGNGGNASKVASLDALAGTVVDGAVLERPTMFAVVPLSPGLADAESLLVAQLSAVDKAVVLERTELDALRKERRVSADFGRTPGANREVGHLLGANALVFLQSYRIGGVEVLEARIVSVATGLVTAVISSAREPDMEKWARALANRCAAEGGRIFTAPKDARLVAVSPFTASLNTPAARAVERQLTVAVRLHLARMPGVFLVEREVLERLRIENQTESRELLGSSWLVSGAVETSLNDDAVTLRLAVAPGGGGATHDLRFEGKTGDPAGIAESVGRGLAPLVVTEAVDCWTPLAEASRWLAQGQAFFARRMWEQAAAAGEAAWVLGLHEDRVRRLRVETITERLKFYGELMPGVKRSRLGLSGIEELVTYRAPLVMPADGPGEPTIEDYVEQANVLLDLFEPSLETTQAKVGGLAYSDWVGGSVWDAATLPFRLGQALSYRREGLELKALGQRLIAASDRALAAARARGDAPLWHTLVALRCNHMAWWAQEDEAFFQNDVLRLLREAKASAAPYSQHAVWETVHAFANAHMGCLNGSKGQAWVRLAHRMSASDDVEERFFGMALLNQDVQGFRLKENYWDRLIADFPTLVEQDQAVPVLLTLQGYGMGCLSGGYYPKGCWYADVFGEQLNASFKDAWWMIEAKVGGRWERGPEIREFYRMNLHRRLELIVSNGPSGVFSPFSRDSGLGLDELDPLIALFQQARGRFVAAAKENPAIKATEAAWSDRLLTVALNEDRAAFFKSTPPPASGRLDLGPPRMLFESELARMTPDRSKSVGWMAQPDLGWEINGQPWFITGLNHGAVFKLSPAGEIAESLWIPDVKTSDAPQAWLVTDGLDDAGIDDHFVVSVAREDRRNTYRQREVILLGDRRTGMWETLACPQPFHQAYDAKLFGGKVYFTFLHNPVIESADPGDYYTRHYESAGDPFRGVMSYDPATRRYELLVSSRRNPAQSPLDDPSGEYLHLIAVNADEFMVAGYEGHVHNARTNKWRASTPADAAQVRANRDRRAAAYLNAGGKRWRPSDLANGIIRFTTNDAEVGLTASWTINATMAAKLKPYPDLLERYVDITPRSRVRCMMTRDGLFLSKGLIYHWIPRAEVEAALSAALAQPVGNISKDPR